MNQESTTRTHACPDSTALVTRSLLCFFPIDFRGLSPGEAGFTVAQQASSNADGRSAAAQKPASGATPPWPLKLVGPALQGTVAWCGTEQTNGWHGSEKMYQGVFGIYELMNTYYVHVVSCSIDALKILHLVWPAGPWFQLPGPRCCLGTRGRGQGGRCWPLRRAREPAARLHFPMKLLWVLVEKPTWWRKWKSKLIQTLIIHDGCDRTCTRQKV